MATARFLTNATLWQEIQDRVKSRKPVRAAVAYFGKGAAGLVRLKRGDRLVVDMSLTAVKQGVTDPREIRKLMRRGVEVFSRGLLHAKFFIIGDLLIVGSANVSNRSRQTLDEAGIATTDPVAFRRAQDFLERLCTEPVREHYLKECIKAYRPPVFKAAAGDAAARKAGRRIVEARVWFISGVPLPEQKQVTAAEGRAKKQLVRPNSSYVDYIHWSYEPSFLRHLRSGDWVVACMTDGERSPDVWAPERVLGVEKYDRGRGKLRYLLLLEAPKGIESIPLGQFRRRIRKLVPELDRTSPRTRAIRNEEDADAVLRLWTRLGRVSRRRSLTRSRATSAGR